MQIPIWAVILIGLVNGLTITLIGILLSKVSGLADKIDDLVSNDRCLERKKVICNKIQEHKKANKIEFEEIWTAFHGHGHADGKVTR